MSFHASSTLTRRAFCQRSVVAATAVVAPLLLPARLRGVTAPSNRIRVGQIGCGRIARVHDIPGVLNSGVADIVAVCDVDAKRAAEGRMLIEQHYREHDLTAPNVFSTGDYRELLARDDVDAIVISTPDHWHAEPALAAVLAGKDLYLQKPMAMTHAESVVLERAVARTGRIFQLGSQQRSSTQWRRAAELIRSGRVGQLRRVEMGLPVDPTRPDNPEQPVPKGLDYEQWLGPTPEVYYTEQRVHPKDGYDRPGWLRNDSYCLGMITGWGAHHYDAAHWAMDVELTGPSRIEARAEFPTNRIWNVHGAYDVHLTYPGGVEMIVSDKFPNGLKFIGDEGWIFVSRQSEPTNDPAVPRGRLRPLDASDDKLLDPNGVRVQLTQSREHHLNSLECVRSRQTPIAPAPVAHRSNTACIVSWIAMKLNRPLEWDPRAERFVNDEEANAMLTRLERGRYGALKLAKKAGLI